MKILFILSITVLIVFAVGCDEMQNQITKPITMPDDEVPTEDSPAETDDTKEDTSTEKDTDDTKEDTSEEPKTMEEDTTVETNVPMEDPPDVPQTPTAVFLSASPSSGDILEYDSISVEFDNDPGTVTASAGTVSGSGNILTIQGPFSVGPLTLTISWTNGAGSHTLIFNVIAADTTSPSVTTSSITDGATDVDPAAVFNSGITVTFSESISSGNLMLLKNGVDVGWTVSISGSTITLTANAGQELSHETTYQIVGTVKDAAGNETGVSISFTTESAPAPPDESAPAPPDTLGPGEGLSIGAEAPDFTLPDGSGTNYTLSDSIGSSNVVIVFFRGGW